MIDIEILRKGFAEAKENLASRGFNLDESKWNDMESLRKELQVKTESLQEHLNKIASQIGEMQKNGKDISQIKKEAGELSASLKVNKNELDSLQKEINEFLLSIPNLLNESVPKGSSEDDNKIIEEVGNLPNFNFKVRDHQELGIHNNGMDFEAAVKISKSRFVVFKGSTAKLNRALIQFMLNLHTSEHGYKEIYVPLLVNSDSLLGTGQLPKFKDDQFKIENEDEDQDLYLIPTAEVPVTNYHRDEILNPKDLPISYVCHTPCFRSEAGSYGQDTKGIIRQHQFEKVELVKLVSPDESKNELEKLTSHAEKVLQLLELPYRKIILCSKDTGFSSSFTYDLEVWLPSQNKYREISSCSNFEDFQSRRMKIRIKQEKKNILCHTINGSGLAIGRTMAAIFENYQNEDGSITVPEVLRPYMDNQKTL
jgi:seryl-tRNA synthetase|tara:strand:+ start:2361 stop:3635 length:1275 start_codon:yes stop_codon:yes gene_type:complete